MDIINLTLHNAVRGAQIEAVRALIEKKVDVNQREDDGILEATPLLIAAQSGKIEILKLLLKAGADFNMKDAYGDTPIHLAISEGHVEIVKLLIDAGIDINLKDYDGSTPLHSAANKDKKDIIKLLLNAGADVNIKDYYGQTPLHVAKDNDEVVKILLDAGADIKIKDNNGDTPLHIAAKVSKNTAKLLIHSGTNIHSKNSDGDTPLHLAVFYKHEEIVKLLLDAGADVNMKNKKYKTALQYAVCVGDTEIEIILIEAGADVKAKDRYGRTLLHEAAENNNHIIIEYLLLKGINVNGKDKLGRTPLHCAAGKNKDKSHLTTIEVLLKNGADVSIQDDENQTSLNYLLENNQTNTEIIELISEYMCKTNLKDKERDEEDKKTDVPIEIKTHIAEVLSGQVENEEKIWQISEYKTQELEENLDFKRTFGSLENNLKKIMDMRRETEVKLVTHLLLFLMVFLYMFF